jgi:predicted MPP superfamily phosphohydrolase
MKKVIIVLCIIALLAVFLYIENNLLSVTRIDISSERLPRSFNDYKIVHLSDLHNKEFGKSQAPLINIIKKEKPDLIVITGDLVDSRNYKPEISLELVRGIIKVAPVYYVSGNHEWRTGRYKELKVELEKLGVTVLSSKAQRIFRGKESIVVGGVDDPTAPIFGGGSRFLFSAAIKKCFKDSDFRDYKILLSHRPEKFLLYKELGIDLVFSGHAHGGQVRIPFIGGIFAPHQGFFPRYTAGAYSEGRTIMVVSRGLGNSVAPQRIFNRPDVVVVTLKHR